MSDDDVARFWDRVVGSGRGLVRFSLRHPATAFRGRRGVRELPELRAELGDAPGGRAIEAALSRDFDRWGAFVLDLAAERDPQVLRLAGWGRARGLTVRAVRDDERTNLLKLADWHTQTYRHPAHPRSEAERLDLRDHAQWRVVMFEGRPVHLTVLPVSGTWAMLGFSRTLTRGPARSLARWVAAADALDVLSALGVRYLLDPQHPRAQSAELRAFRRMVGFRFARVRVVGAPWFARGVSAVVGVLGIAIGGTAFGVVPGPIEDLVRALPSAIGIGDREPSGQQTSAASPSDSPTARPFESASPTATPSPTPTPTPTPTMLASVPVDSAGPRPTAGPEPEPTPTTEPEPGRTPPPRPTKPPKPTHTPPPRGGHASEKGH